MRGANRGLPSLSLSAIGQPGQTGATHSALLWGERHGRHVNSYSDPFFLKNKNAAVAFLISYFTIQRADYDSVPRRGPNNKHFRCLINKQCF